MTISLKKLQPLLVLLGSCVVSSKGLAAGEVRHVGTSTVPATPYRYTAEGLTHTWGAGENQLIESFTTDSDTFRFAAMANRVELVRDDITDVSTGVPCGVFVERAGPNASLLAADFPNDAAGTGNCDMADMLASRIVNRGTLDLFSNSAPTPKNVERVDYIFDSGVFAAFTREGLVHTGHLVFRWLRFWLWMLLGSHCHMGHLFVCMNFLAMKKTAFAMAKLICAITTHSSKATL